MKDTLLPCLLPVLGRKFAVRLQIFPTKVFLLCMQTDRKRGLRGEGRVEVLGVELGFSGFGFQSFRGLGSLQGLIN